jgi:small GTP-binding protein
MVDQIQFDKKINSSSGSVKALPLGNANLAYDYFFKIIIIGDPCCGKTSLLLRTTMNKRNEAYETTIGVDCKSRTFDHKNKRVKLQIWDTAGQERFKTVTTSYYRGTHCCVLMFDITN